MIQSQHLLNKSPSAHSGLSPYYYAPNTYANILPYAAWPTVAAPEAVKEE